MKVRPKRARGLWGPTVAATGWGESTFAEISWDKSRNAALRWAVAGAVVGLIVALIVFAPAAWLANRVASVTGQRLLLADARGTVWNGSAVAIVTGGEGSRDAASLPGRLSWAMRPHGFGLELRLGQACCLNGMVTIRVKPGFGRTSITLLPTPGWVGQWPAALLGGLGTPFNTMQLGGSVRLESTGLKIDSVQGRWLVDGRADLVVVEASSRLSTLASLGSYRLSMTGDAASQGFSQLVLGTESGPLQLSGTGTWGPAGVRFRGEARAAPDEQAALSNLLNIIGRRDGARSVISIG